MAPRVPDILPMDPTYAPMAEDVRILSGQACSVDEISLVAIARNEMPLLPSFLKHYRALGVKHFIILDDASEDNSREFLARQNDVLLLGSSRRYGEPVALGELPKGYQPENLRQIHLWRTSLMNRFCHNRWAIQCDVDEFAMLPDGQTFQGIAALCDNAGENGVWAGMFDIYPASIEELIEPVNEWLYNTPWYFEGVRHFSLRRKAPPRHHYSGLRLRLSQEYLNDYVPSRFQSFRTKWFGARKSGGTRLVKPLLQKWQRGNFYLSSHATTIPLSRRRLIPLAHYRYTPALMNKIDWAKISGGYSRNNSDYHSLDTLLNIMRTQSGTFLGPNSRRLRGYDDFAATGNAFGLLN